MLKLRLRLLLVLALSLVTLSVAAMTAVVWLPSDNVRHKTEAQQRLSAAMAVLKAARYKV